MTDISIKLSAYLDGELDAAEARSVEALLEKDPALQAELDALIAADAMAEKQFDALLGDPVPLALAQKIKALPVGDAPMRRAPRPVWGALAAGLALFVFGGMGGYLVRDRIAPAGEQVARAGWLNDIADYHAVYSGQQRHLVEVTADESDHLKQWLGTSIGVAFSIPDLTGFGLTFEGGRLLVANGRPVGQLMYRQGDRLVPAKQPEWRHRICAGFQGTDDQGVRFRFMETKRSGLCRGRPWRSARSRGHCGHSSTRDLSSGQ